MDSVHRENIIKFYDERAPKYDSEPDGLHFRLAKDFAKWAQPVVPKDLQSPLKMLDLGCGTGMVSMAALELFGPDSVIDGVDISSVSLDIAREKAKDRGSKSMHFYEGSATNLKELPLEKASYSLINCCSAFVLLHGDPSDILRLWSEYLKPGGVLVVDVLMSGIQVASELATRALSPYGKQAVERGWIQSDASIRQVIQSSGLECRDVLQTGSYRDIEYRIEDTGETWDRMMQTPIYQVGTLAEEQAKKAKQSFIDMFKSFIGESGIFKDQARFFICIATKSWNFFFPGDIGLSVCFSNSRLLGNINWADEFIGWHAGYLP